ncbi:N-alpha-acetyltransferase 35, NatC auxiliary subunit [Smittium culicis]|uniref:N-alpha-acetyltransferase 35, NatC auxiliary subunit n=1 Tax=Smittium culicis TaxID=133412 RepID=A0A1R1XMU0_9FUNG|nr:N-alpha-acetyltransferase 35, NatC auxiliary subunit [Smittium culicis]
MEDFNDFNWIDITDLVKESAAALLPGQMIRNKNFTLFDSMAALEIMNSKMDTGYVDLDFKDEIYSIDTEINLEQNIHSFILLANSILIPNSYFIIELNFLQNMFYDGIGLPQTLYSCLYYSYEHLDSSILLETINSRFYSSKKSPLLFRDLVIYPIVIATAKCSQILLNELKNHNIFSEEDFSLNTYSKDFYKNIQINDAIRLLENSINYFRNNRGFIHEYILESYLEHYADLEINNLTINPEIEAHKIQSKINSNLLIDELLTRLELKLNWLLSLNFYSYDNISKTPENYFSSFSPLLKISELSQKLKTSKLLSLKPENFSLRFVFDPNFIRKLSVDAPCKSVETISFEESLEILKNFSNELELIPIVLNIKSVSQLVHFSQSFSLRSPSATAYSRSLFQSILFNNDRFLIVHPMSRLIKSQISNSIGPLPFSFLNIHSNYSDSLKSSNHKNNTQLNRINSSIDNFISMSSETLINIIKSYYQNYPRQRRVHAQLLYDLDYLQHNSESLDTHIHEYLGNDGFIDNSLIDPSSNTPNMFLFSNFVFFTKCSLMQHFLDLGFPLNIYQPYEYSQVYWYLHNNFRITSSIIDRISSINEIFESRIAISESNSNQNPFLPTYYYDASVNPTFEDFPLVFNPSMQINFKSMFLEAQRVFSFGQYLLHRSLELLGLIPKPWDIYIYKNSTKIISLFERYKKELSYEFDDDNGKHEISIDSYLVNAAENCLNSLNQNSKENQNSRFNLRFRTVSRLKTPEFHTFNDFFEFDNSILDNKSLKDILELCEKSLGTVNRLLPSLKVGLNELSTDEEFSQNNMKFDPSTNYNNILLNNKHLDDSNKLQFELPFKPTEKYLLEQLLYVSRLSISNYMMCNSLLNIQKDISSINNPLKIKCVTFSANLKNLSCLVLDVYRHKLLKSSKNKDLGLDIQTSDFTRSEELEIHDFSDFDLNQIFEHHKLEEMSIFWNNLNKCFLDRFTLDFSFKYHPFYPLPILSKK